MRIVTKILKWILYFLMIPLGYLVISIILTYITVNNSENETDNNKLVYLSSNGVHLNIIIHQNDLDIDLKNGLEFTEDEEYLSFGWGDENFYLNTPTWDDLTLKNAFIALFLKSSALIHLTRWKQVNNSWTKVIIGESELKKLNHYLSMSFKKDVNGKKIILNNSGYSINDDFYKASGSFSCFKTCNTWVNKAFKESGLKSCLWTPFDFGLLNKYE
ncbi:MAG: DUF2459 domain-containing protein [Cyclobacteriaceae bacterium]|nr:DUF2459 domain-containing protein [Cyclobacteriaceae bacterium]